MKKALVVILTLTLLLATVPAALATNECICDEPWYLMDGYDPCVPPCPGPVHPAPHYIACPPSMFHCGWQEPYISWDLCSPAYKAKLTANANSIAEFRENGVKWLKRALELYGTGWELISESGIKSVASGSHSTITLREVETGKTLEIIAWAYTHNNSSCKPESRTYYLVFAWEYFAKTKIANLPADNFITPTEVTDIGEAVNYLVQFLVN